PDSTIHGNDASKAAGVGETHKKVDCCRESADQRTMQNPAVRNLSENPPCDAETADQSRGARKRDDLLRSENLQRGTSTTMSTISRRNAPATILPQRIRDGYRRFSSHCPQEREVIRTFTETLPHLNREIMTLPDSWN